MLLSIGIKALNEQRRIANSIASALQVANKFSGEVILADCASTDQTVQIASSYPIRIVRMAAPEERSCGAGAQLAYQESKGQFFYLMDGDMVLNSDAAERFMEFLNKNPEYAGVGGRTKELVLTTHEFRIRAKSEEMRQCTSSIDVDRLDGGGLYRRAAIESVGYFADQNLKAFEEFELGARLLTNGWKLARLDVTAVEHFGHDVPSYSLLWTRFVSGYACGAGQVFRASIGKATFLRVVKNLAHIKYSLAVCSASLTSAFIAALYPWSGLAFVIAMLGSGIILLSFRRQSLRLGVFSLVAWILGSIAFLRGALWPRQDPFRVIQHEAIATKRTEDLKPMSGTCDR
ncbi:glycosyltransferase [Alsobacter sp. KACC 23698]|uniref:Glycosyltransferase n=1 Tax=Alsobacter sp. KACC 23698 TaxID=3149229 RepID=A0AAU7JJB8_9HYPH